VAAVKVHLGCGDKPFAGWVNVDARPLPGVTVGHAHRIPVPDRSVDVLYSHAVFEHLFFPHHVAAISEWQRVLAPGGAAVALGIPDFEAVCRLYLAKAEGLCGPVYNLYEAYRHTHGSPDQFASDVWSTWNPARAPDQAPPGWLPQLHKSPFDTESLRALLDVCDVMGTVFGYAYPLEPRHVMNLGFVIVAGPEILEGIPGIEHVVDFDTIETR
jgi:SAM-dependent methyltransferase